MANMFGGSAPEPPAPPVPEPPPTMPTPFDKLGKPPTPRAGRASTIMSNPISRRIAPLAVGNDYSGKALG